MAFTRRTTSPTWCVHVVGVACACTGTRAGGNNSAGGWGWRAWLPRVTLTAYAVCPWWPQAAEQRCAALRRVVLGEVSLAVGSARSTWWARQRKLAQVLLADGVSSLGSTEPASSPASVRPLLHPVLATAEGDSFTRSTWPGLTAEATAACTALCQPEALVTLAVACANEVAQQATDGGASALVATLCDACFRPVQAAVATAVADAPGLPVEARVTHATDVMTAAQVVMACLLRATTVVDCQARGGSGAATLGLATGIMRRCAKLIPALAAAHDKVTAALGDKLAAKWAARAVR